MRKFIIAVASLLLFASVSFAQKKDPPKPATTSTAAPAAKAADPVPAVDKDTQIAVLRLQKDQVQLQAQFARDQQDMQQIQQQFQKDAQELLGLKLKAEAVEHGKYELDLATLTFKPNPAPANAPKKN